MPSRCNCCAASAPGALLNISAKFRRISAKDERVPAQVAAGVDALPATIKNASAVADALGVDLQEAMTLAREARRRAGDAAETGPFSALKLKEVLELA